MLSFNHKKQSKQQMLNHREELQNDQFCRGITNMAALVISIYARLDISRWILIIQKRHICS